MWPDTQSHPRYTDSYFNLTRQVLLEHGDAEVTYAVFMRRPVTLASQLAIDWLLEMTSMRGVEVKIDHLFKEGSWVGAGEPMFYITGSMVALVDLETLFLQKLGAACVAAYNAYHMSIELPEVSFIAMDARHCAGTEMAELMAYGASVGSKKAISKNGAKGFVGCAADATAHFFGMTHGMGTMPHALIGYAGSTVRAAELFHKTFPERTLTVLVDYFGQEIEDAIAVANAFPELANKGQLGVRIDTHGGRFVQGLDTQQSYAVLDRNVPDAIRGYRTEQELKHLMGTGVSAAAIWHMREKLNERGFNSVKIIASSGFSPDKCRVFSLAKTPVDIIGTGSYLPSNWSDTYATADIISYNGKSQVKIGREFLFSNY
ncbi:MAG: nicotinate phosphoribosyltransferase, partial [Alphaproteobacteria bacterium]|nr:nicotinate phosphoribosyltransferase [Alphaproteobacteria bacterium]